MADLLDLPTLRVPAPPPDAQRPLVVSAVVAGVAVALVGLLGAVALAVVGWFAGNAGTFGDATGVGLLTWLDANGSGITVAGVAYSAIPLGALGLVGYGLFRAGRWVGSGAAVGGLRDVAIAAAAVMSGYVVVVAVAAAVARTSTAHAGLLRVLLVSIAVSFIGSGFGVAAGGGVALAQRLPDPQRRVLHGASVTAGLVLGAASLLVVGSLLSHRSTVAALYQGMGSGVVGGALLCLVALALLPNAVLCAVAFAAGPGFAVGAGTTVAPGGVHLGPLPDFPLLAALPMHGGGWWGYALVGIFAVCGWVGAVVVGRRYPVAGTAESALHGALVGGLGGLACGVATWLATGSVGPGRLQQMGPDVLDTALVATVLAALGGVVGALATEVDWATGGADWVRRSVGRRRDLFRGAVPRRAPGAKHGQPGVAAGGAVPAGGSDTERTAPVPKVAAADSEGDAGPGVR